MKTPTTLTPLMKSTIKTAVRNLTSLGCKFKVIDIEGEEYGDLLVVSPKKRAGGKRIYNFAEHGYIDKVRALQPGQSDLFEAPDGIPPEKYRGAIASCASKYFGVGTCTSHIEGNIIEVLRLA